MSGFIGGYVWVYCNNCKEMSAQQICSRGYRCTICDRINK